MKPATTASVWPVIADAYAISLDWRARHRAVRAIHAAVALFGLHLQTATIAFIEILAGVRGHGLDCRVPASRTSYGRSQFDHLGRPNHTPPRPNAPKVSGITQQVEAAKAAAKPVLAKIFSSIRSLRDGHLQTATTPNPYRSVLPVRNRAGTWRRRLRLTPAARQRRLLVERSSDFSSLWVWVSNLWKADPFHPTICSHYRCKR
jgi:hypothetical protein